TKVVTFGAFVEIMDGVEGLVHISELAHHHVENPREIVEPGQDVRVKILEIDSERRRLSLSVKRVEEQLAHIKSAAEAGAAAAEANASELGEVPDLGLSEDVFAGPSIGGLDALRNLPADEPADEEAPEAPELDAATPEADAEADAEAPEAEVPEAEPAPDAVDAEPAPDAEPEPAAEATEEPAAPPAENEESQDQ
ncbi:MAG TPA: S1 RNA-binding domain-containing protein, partial [Thermoleophilaceae bacterium]|nr:S1 RNA-binding domain-containing protein [Thermoleophilaceae bacterium]